MASDESKEKETFHNNQPQKFRSGQVRSECLTCTFRASCCWAHLSRAQVPAFPGSSVQDRKKKRGEGVRGNTCTGGYKGVRAVRPESVAGRGWRSSGAKAWLFKSLFTFWSWLFQPVLHDWCNKCCGMCYPVCGMVHIKELLLLIGKSSPCGSSGFLLSLSEWSFTIYLTPYNHK